MKITNVFKTKKVLMFLFCPALLAVLLYIFPVISLFATDQYEYDSLGRLKKATHNDGTQVEYSYDKTGNRASSGEKVSSQNTPPNLPEVVCPGNGDTGVLNPIFSWTGGDPDGASETVKYSIYIKKNTCSTCSFSTCSADIGDSVASISAAGNVGQLTFTWNQTLDAGSCYYWKVVPEDSKGAKPTSQIDVWSFLTTGCL